jgi:hypothetical protein
MRIIQNNDMPMDDQFRIRCDREWKTALKDVARRRKLDFAEWVRLTLGESAIDWCKANDLPVPKALLDLEVDERTHVENQISGATPPQPGAKEDSLESGATPPARGLPRES